MWVVCTGQNVHRLWTQFSMQHVTLWSHVHLKPTCESYISSWNGEEHGYLVAVTGSLQHLWGLWGSYRVHVPSFWTCWKFCSTYSRAANFGWGFGVRYARPVRSQPINVAQVPKKLMSGGVTFFLPQKFWQPFSHSTHIVGVPFVHHKPLTSKKIK